jgi:hypothetical protein
MSIKIDLRNQVRQTILPKWKPLLPLFEAVMNSFQAVKDAGHSGSSRGSISIEVEREKPLLAEENPAVIGFRVVDDGIGLTDENFDSFNTAFSPYKMRTGGKGLGRFTWLKAFERAQITSTFKDQANGGLLRRTFNFDENYDLDERGLPRPVESGEAGTTIHLVNFYDNYKSECPRTTEVLIEKIIEHFLLVLLEPSCPNFILLDQSQT